MARTKALIAIMAAFSGLLIVAQIAGAESLNDRFGDTAAAVFGLAWLAVLALLAKPFLMPLVRR